MRKLKTLQFYDYDPTVDSFLSVIISEMPEVEIEIVFLDDK